MTKLSTRPAVASDKFTARRIAVTNGPDLVFDGILIGEYSTQNRAGTKDRWTELRLWETAAGAWIAESTGATAMRNEQALTDATIIQPDLDEDAARFAVMNAFDWSPAAKAFARDMDWDVRKLVP